MTETVQIRRLAAHYRLRPSQSEQKRRLDSVLRDVIGEALDLALGSAGVRPEEMICIRRLDVPIRLNLSRGNSGLAADWARLLAQAIALAASTPYASVRYGSRRLALIDMGSDIAQVRFHNVWAWRQIGFWRGGDSSTNLADAVSEFAGALCREPEAAVPALSVLSARNELRAMAPYLKSAWAMIAGTVLEIAGVSLPPELRGLVVSRADHDFGSSGEPRTPAYDSWVVSLAQDRAKTVVERSSILRELRNTQLSQLAAKSLAFLALLECEPSLVRAGNQFFETAQTVYELEFRRPDVFLDSGKPHFVEANLQPIAWSPISANSARSKSEQPTLRTVGFTEFAGLLYLLSIEEELKIPERALALPAVGARGLCWFQHRLALTLQPIPPDDPAALAFSGLGPTTIQPSWLQPPPTVEEQRLIHAFAVEVQAALAEFFPESARSTEQLTSFVCRRSAHIVADPGWLEVRFSLLDVSVEIRRAGLDIDPDYLPWLGLVLRFVYG
jgi:hypothetical protein